MSLRIDATLCKAALAAGLSLAMLVHAAAATYQITTRSSGTGYFELDGMFDLPGPIAGDAAYTLSITATVTDPLLIDTSATSKTWTDNNASVEVDLEVGGVHYRIDQANQYVYFQYHADSWGNPNHVLRLHTELTPYDRGNYAALTQTMRVVPGALPFSDTLTPVALTSPAVSEALATGGVYVSYSDVFYSIGEVSAFGQQASFAIAAVPEPATYAMTLLGCAVLAGAAAQRSRRQR